MDDWSQVPDVEADAEVDPHWQELRGDWSLPLAYLPPAMSGVGRLRPPWMRVSAWVLITVFLTATTGGVCLTYGPGS